MFAFFNEVSCESCSFCNGFFSDTFDCSFPVSFPVYDCVHYYFIFVLPTRNAISRPKRVKFFQCLNETFHTKNDKKCLLVWTKKKTSQLSSALSEKCARKMCSTPKKKEPPKHGAFLGGKCTNRGACFYVLVDGECGKEGNNCFFFSPPKARPCGLSDENSVSACRRTVYLCDFRAFLPHPFACLERILLHIQVNQKTPFSTF